ncbi:MAG: hypothetical protein ACP5O3_02000 [Candidatus Micrarchaeia archaeon]|jgi:hypothetical protein
MTAKKRKQAIRKAARTPTKIFGRKPSNKSKHSKILKLKKLAAKKKSKRKKRK